MVAYLERMLFKPGLEDVWADEKDRVGEAILGVQLPPVCPAMSVQ